MTEKSASKETKSKPTLEQLQAVALEAKKVHEVAEARVQEYVNGLELNSYLAIAGVPYQVVARESGGKTLRCMLTKAAAAVQRGETPPPPKTRKKRSQGTDEKQA